MLTPFEKLLQGKSTDELAAALALVVQRLSKGFNGDAVKRHQLEMAREALTAELTHRQLVIEGIEDDDEPF